MKRLLSVLVVLVGVVVAALVAGADLLDGGGI